MTVEAHVTFSEESLASGVQFPKDSFAVLRWMLVGGAVCQMLAQIGKIGIGAIMTFLTLTVIAFFFLPMWQEKKERDRLARHPWKGKEVRFVFGHERIEVHAPDGTKAIDIECITRASQDERGILLMGPQIGSLWIPSVGFLSAEERKSAFEIIRASLKKKG
jgi:hypothetical protein